MTSRSRSNKPVISSGENERLGGKYWYLDEKHFEDPFQEDRVVEKKSSHTSPQYHVFYRGRKKRHSIIVLSLNNTDFISRPPLIVRIHPKQKVRKCRTIHKPVIRIYYYCNSDAFDGSKVSWTSILRSRSESNTGGEFKERNPDAYCTELKEPDELIPSFANFDWKDQLQCASDTSSYRDTRTDSKQFIEKPASHTNISHSRSNNNNNISRVERVLSELVDDLDNSIVPDHNSPCGFVVTYPEMETEGIKEVSSTGTQLGEGILSEPAYSVAMEFAKKHGYGFVEFAEDLPLKTRRTRRTKKGKERQIFARVVSTRDEARSVVRKDAKTPRHRKRVRKCATKTDLQRDGILSHLSYLEYIERSRSSVEEIAGQIYDIDINDFNNPILSTRQLAKEQPSLAEVESESSEDEDEIIRSAPLKDYMQYLNKVCKNICQDKGDGSSKHEMEPSGQRDDQGGLEHAGDCTSPGRPTLKSSGNQDETDSYPSATTGDQERKHACNKIENNNNISMGTKTKGYGKKRNPKRGEEVKEFLSDTSYDDLPKIGTKTNLQYRFSNSLSSCILREKMLLHSNTNSDLGVNSDLLKAKMQVVRYDCILGSEREEEAKIAGDEGSKVRRQDSVTGCHDQKSPQVSSSSPGTASAKAFRQTALTSESTRLPSSGFKLLKHDHTASSCMDLSSAQKSDTRAACRSKDVFMVQRSPTKESVGKSAADSDPELFATANSTSCAQGDFMGSPSREVRIRPQDQGDVDITSKDAASGEDDDETLKE